MKYESYEKYYLKKISNFYKSYRAVSITEPRELGRIERFSGTGREEIYVYRTFLWTTFTEIQNEVLRV
jgi:hypothetical protein